MVLLASLLVSILTVYGALIKRNYDQTLRQKHTLRGNGHDGVVTSFQKAIDEQTTEQQELARIVTSHSALMQEVVYTMDEIAETHEGADGIEEIDMRRLEHLEQALRTYDIEEELSYKPEEGENVPDVAQQVLTEDEDD